MIAIKIANITFTRESDKLKIFMSVYPSHDDPRDQIKFQEMIQ
jgi:hypothetical protein